MPDRRDPTRIRSAVVALAVAAVVATSSASEAVSPSPEAFRPAAARARSRLSDIQRRFDAVTTAKRPTYRLTVELEARIAAASGRVRHVVAATTRALRGQPAPIRADALRWTLQGLVPQLRRRDLLRGELRTALGRMRTLHLEALILLRESHAIVESTWKALGGSAAAWERVWPVGFHPGEVLQVCPVAGPWSLTDTFGAPRPGGRTHQGLDIIAAWGTPIRAAHAGTAVRVPNPLGGRAVLLYGAEGTTYYAHMSAYGLAGRVAAGNVIGFVGNSGSARGRIHHLHFEWRPGNGGSVDPYRTVLRICPDGDELPGGGSETD